MASDAMREEFEQFWLETRGSKRARRELVRHPLQPQTYVADSANRHWVTFQAASRTPATEVAGSSDGEDAERYRAFFEAGLPITFLGVDYRTKDELDAAIDAARSKEAHRG